MGQARGIFEAAFTAGTHFVFLAHIPPPQDYLNSKRLKIGN
jgi:hypothetical protein